MRLLVSLGLALLASGAALAQDAPSPEQRLLAEWGAMQGAAQAHAQALQHTAEAIRAVLARQAAQDAERVALADYWARYVAGLKGPAEAGAPR